MMSPSVSFTKKETKNLIVVIMLYYVSEFYVSEYYIM